MFVEICVGLYFCDFIRTYTSLHISTIVQIMTPQTHKKTHCQVSSYALVPKTPVIRTSQRASQGKTVTYRWFIQSTCRIFFEKLPTRFHGQLFRWFCVTNHLVCQVSHEVKGQKSWVRWLTAHQEAQRCLMLSSWERGGVTCDGETL